MQSSDLASGGHTEAMERGHDESADHDSPAGPRRTAELEALRDEVVQTARVACSGAIKAFVDAQIDVVAGRIDVSWKGSPPASVISVLEAAPAWVRVRVRRVEWTERELDRGCDILATDSRPKKLAAQIYDIVPTLSLIRAGGNGLLVGYDAESDDPVENARISDALTAIVGIPVRARRTDENDTPVFAI